MFSAALSGPRRQESSGSSLTYRANHWWSAGRFVDVTGRRFADARFVLQTPVVQNAAADAAPTIEPTAASGSRAVHILKSLDVVPLERLDAKYAAMLSTNGMLPNSNPATSSALSVS